MKILAEVYNHKNCIISLCGRSITAEDMMQFTKFLKIKADIFVIEPPHFEWYPLPNGPTDQSNAIRGQKKSLLDLKNLADKISKMGYNISLLGYSAGAVMALQLLTEKFNCCCCLSGAILDPASLPETNNNTPILVDHGIMDKVFDWYERYLPMKEALINKKYNVTFNESIRGHELTNIQVNSCREFISSSYRDQTVNR